MALRVGGALKAWASDTNNAPIRQEASINKTTFSRGRDDLRDDIAQQIHDLGNANVAALAPFGVTAATISALQTRIDVYRAAIGSPQAARAQKVTATSLLVNEFDRADMILADRTTRTTFYSDYKNSRKIASKPVITQQQPTRATTEPVILPLSRRLVTENNNQNYCCEYIRYEIHGRSASINFIPFGGWNSDSSKVRSVSYFV